VALVTGANRGIGLEIARQLLKASNRVVLGARDIARGEKAAELLRARNVFPMELDVTNEGMIAKVVRSVKSDFGRLDILVNNAGILLDETDRPSETSLEIVRSTLETNLVGAWRLCQAAIPLMKEHNYGRIVNVSSGAGSIVSIGNNLYAPAYSVSKTGLNGLTILLASELRGTNILVNAVCPGWVRTDMGGASAPRSVEEGADTAVWLATLPENGPSGSFFRDRVKIEW